MATHADVSQSFKSNTAKFHPSFSLLFSVFVMSCLAFCFAVAELIIYVKFVSFECWDCGSNSNHHSFSPFAQVHVKCAENKTRELFSAERLYDDMIRFL